MASLDANPALDRGVAARPGYAAANPRLGAFVQTLHRTILDLENRFEEQRRLREVTHRANHGVRLDDILEQLYEAFRPLIDYDRIGLALVEDGGRVLRARWVRSEAGPLRLQPGFEIPLEGHPLRRVLERGRPRVLDDIESYLRRHPDAVAVRLLYEEGLRSTLACPLIAVGKPVGFLFVSSTRPGAYDGTHAEVLSEVAQDVSMIVEKGRMFEELQRSHERLEEEVRALARTESALRQTQKELEAANRELAALAATDGLTGVANRRAFDESLDREWRRAIRGGLPLSLILLDIDAFKPFNDTRGHLAGDDSLRMVAGAVRDCLKRPGDLVSRYGGEEFAVLLPETDEGPAAMLAERMRAAIQGLGIAHGCSPVAAVVTASLGVASARPGVGDDPAALVRSADLALYHAKREGRNRVRASSGPA